MAVNTRLMCWRRSITAAAGSTPAQSTRGLPRGGKWPTPRMDKRIGAARTWAKVKRNEAAIAQLKRDLAGPTPGAE